jgi:phosphoglycolate phosphatase
VFDFDGTLVLSNQIKRDGFLVLAEEFPAGRPRMEEILRAAPGDRVAILSTFAAQMGSGDLAEALIARYGTWCEERLLVCPERAGAEDVLGSLRAEGLRMCINSATPTEPLHAVVARRFPSHIFEAVLGGHGRKKANLEWIARQLELRVQEIVMVGDGTDDYQAARGAGCHFIGVSDGTLASTYSGTMIDDLRDVPALLAQLEKQTS